MNQLTPFETLVQKTIEQINAAVKESGIYRCATCDAPNWDKDLHQVHNTIKSRGIEGLSISSKVNHEVTDWVITRTPQPQAPECAESWAVVKSLGNSLITTIEGRNICKTFSESDVFAPLIASAPRLLKENQRLHELTLSQNKANFTLLEQNQQQAKDIELLRNSLSKMVEFAKIVEYHQGGNHICHERKNATKLLALTEPQVK